MVTARVGALRKKSLCACVAAFLAASSVNATVDTDAIASSTHGNVFPAPRSIVRSVTNCNDSGAGSLREAIDAAVSGAAIDLTQLTCSEISLNGKLSVTVPDLMLLGPGAGADATHVLTIHGTYGYRILEHGPGTLVVSGLKLAYGHYVGPLARGGCILSQGTLIVEDSMLTDCEVDAPAGSNGLAAGGAIYTQGELWMRDSVVTSNVVYSSANAAYGGGIFASSRVTIEGSTISENEVITAYADAVGGGVMVVGVDDVRIASSTISGNEAEFAGGIRTDTLGTVQIVNSTISDNHASLYVGGGSFSNGPVALRNSTVTRNTAYAYMAGILSGEPLIVESSILADNRDVAVDATFDVCAPSVTGSHNLIVASCANTEPDLAQCPRLSALKNHGGLTSTHALLPGSNGVDAGDNPTGLIADQRGVRFSRSFGSAVDIGAYERQDEIEDAIFRSAFENRCDRYD